MYFIKRANFFPGIVYEFQHTKGFCPRPYLEKKLYFIVANICLLQEKFLHFLVTRHKFKLLMTYKDGIDSN